MTPLPKPGVKAGGAAAGSLYPPRYQGGADPCVVFEEACESAATKISELIELRRATAARFGRSLADCATAMAGRLAAGGRLLTFGNGGSATDAQWLASLFKQPGNELAALPAICLASNAAVLTAMSATVGVEGIFARQIAALGLRGDIAVGLSTSGNSENMLRAFDEASRRGMLTVGLAGYEGGKMAELVTLDFLFVAPSVSVHRIQEAQTAIYHVLWELTTARLGSMAALA
jgi:D-sedoheptulose 7-phosphate isomerase